MKKTVIAAVLCLVVALAAAGVARADVSVRANGKTYTPAPNIPKYTTNDGFVPAVDLPTSDPYYATKPPHGDYVEVYATRLDHLVWVPLAQAAYHGWYVSHHDGLSLLAKIGIGVVAGALVGLIVLAWPRRRRG